jgi:hypothetical protein
MHIAPTSDVDGEVVLIAAVLRTARRDLHSRSPEIRHDAERFWSGYRGGLRMWCEIVGMSPDELRRRLLNGIEP